MIDDKIKTVIEFDAVPYSNGAQLREIECKAVAFIVDGCAKYIVSIDFDTGHLSVYKIGFRLNEINVRPTCKNQVIIS